MDEVKGGLPAGAAADEASAGEELTGPGSGGSPAGKHVGGEGGSGWAGGGGGGGSTGGVDTGGTLPMDGVLFSVEEGDYAADSERSTDHEPTQRYGNSGGSARESDGQEHSEREREIARRGRGRRRGNGNRGSTGDGTSGPLGSGVESSGRRTRGRNAARSAGGGGGISTAGGRASASEATVYPAVRSRSRQNSDGEELVTSRRSGATPKRRRVNGASGGGRRVGTRGGVSGGEEDTPADRQSRSKDEVSSRDAPSVSTGGSSTSEGLRDDSRMDVTIDLCGAEHESDILGDDGGRAKVDEVESKSMRTGSEERQHNRVPHNSPPQGNSVDCDHAAAVRGSGQRGLFNIGVPSPSAQPTPKHEDDRDHANSCTSSDSAVAVCEPETIADAGGALVKPNGELNSANDSICARMGDGHDGSGESSSVAGDGSTLAVPAPNTPGGAVPWHHTSVYEANDPTEDRHVELVDEALGVRIYCVCDGHGGSRAAQFVCDNLAKDVFAQVEEMAGVATPRRRGRRATASVSAGISTGNRDDVWAKGVDDEAVRRLLKEAFSSCDERFIAQLDPKKNRGYINAGCCVVLALLIRSRLFVAHVGDCRAVLGTTDATRFPAEITSLAGTKHERGAAQGHKGGSATQSKAEAPTTSPPSSPSPGSGSSGAEIGELVAVALSRDHNCNDEEEVSLVRARSSDGNAIRVSRNDEWRGARAIKRVAGSLAVTRAIGDAYLKEAVFSFSPYKVR